MKITCHSCQSKYNVADEKVQGKTVKIRCKKCGATLVISADGVQGNGISAPPPAPTADQITFTVNVAEGDQRSMTIEEIVVAYNDGTVTQETYLWADGMTDWLPLAQVESIVAALHSAASAPPPPPDQPAAYEAPPAYEPPPAYAAAPAYDPAPAPAADERRAARREGARGTRDLFAAQPGGDDGLSASAASAFAPPPGGGNGASGGAMTTGARNENSVLFSLAVLTKDEAPAAMPMGSMASAPSRKEDSGLIDLKALSLAAAASSGGATPEFAAPLFAPAAPFGSFDSPALPLGGSIAPDAQPKNKMMLIVAAAAVVVALAAIVALVVVMKSGNKNDATAASASASASSAPEVAASASAEPTPSASAVASSTPADSASATVAVAKPKPGVKPPPGAAPPPGIKPPPAAATTPAPKPKGGGDCGCAGDLMCLMKCRSGH